MAEINNAKVIVDYADMQAIASAIKNRTGSTEGITITEMPMQIGGIVGGEDVAAETATYTDELAELQTKITALEGALEGKADGGSTNGEVATCTIEIINETKGMMLESQLHSVWFVAYENGEYKGYSGVFNFNSILPDGFDWDAEKNILNNVVCGSMIYLSDSNGCFTYPYGWTINGNVDAGYLLVPSTPNATHTIKMEIPW